MRHRLSSRESASCEYRVGLQPEDGRAPDLLRWR